MTMRVPHLCLIATGTVIISLVILISWLVLPKIIESQIKDKVRLVEGSDTWNAWVSVPIPIYLKFYLYNVTNPSEIEQGAKPRVSEVGPFVYLQKRTKVDIEIDTEKDTVRYRQPVTYFFDREKSAGSEDDQLTVLNMVYVGVIELGHKLTQEEFLLQTLDELIIAKGEKLFRTQKVRELLFEGFSVHNFLDLLSDPVIQSAGNVKVPSAFADGKFGLFKGKNMSDEGVFEIKSGISNFTEFGQIISWNNKTQLSWWKDTCNSIKGTDGTLFQPFLTKSSRLNLFAPDLCRSMYVTFKSETECDGVPAYRFSLPNELLQSVKSNPDNWCFCKDPENATRNTCKSNASGILNIAVCKEGSPIIASSPHFYQADADIISGIDGISPIAEKHETFLDLEPRTGLVLRAAKRLQFNMILKPYEYIPTFANLRTVVFPLVWVEETATLEGKTLEMVQTLTVIFNVVGIAKWILLGIGALILVGGIVLASFRKAEIIPN